MDRKSAIYLLRFLYGELFEQNIWLWTKQQIEGEFGDLSRCLSAYYAPGTPETEGGDTSP